MSVGFRPTAADNEIIQAHKHPGESTSDVLRRALRALDREEWERRARADMERIAASGEDLSEEPDEWGLDDSGQLVDLRSDEPREDASKAAPEPFSVDEALTRLRDAGMVAASRPALRSGAGFDVVSVPMPVGKSALAVHQAKWDPLTRILPQVEKALAAETVTALKAISAQLHAAGSRLPSAKPQPAVSGPVHSAVWHATPPERERPVPRKLQQLRAAARRAKRR